MKRLDAPFSKEKLAEFNIGDIVYITGEILTARDAAHKRLDDMIKAGKPLPIFIDGQIIYYTGACPVQGNEAIGSCGPTTSKRMDSFTPTLYDMGLLATIGKGERSKEVFESIAKNRAIYFSAIGGAGAFYSQAVTKCELICFEDLGTEAVYRLTVKDFAVVVSGK
jgi:fumarate hydratase subunit beta